MKKKTRKIYTKKHFNSNEGMLTTIWGPSLWHLLHTISFNYPVKPTCEDKKNYKNFIFQLRYILPCKYCRINIVKNLKKHPLTSKNLRNRETFSRWMYELHEVVNKMLKKKSGLSYSDVRERYEHFRSRCTLSKRKKKKVKKVKKGKRTRKKEKGCVEPLYGEKSKCILHIVPSKKKCKTFKIDNKCVKKRSLKNRSK